MGLGASGWVCGDLGHAPAFRPISGDKGWERCLDQPPEANLGKVGVTSPPPSVLQPPPSPPPPRRASASAPGVGVGGPPRALPGDLDPAPGGAHSRAPAS